MEVVHRPVKICPIQNATYAVREIIADKIESDYKRPAIGIDDLQVLIHADVKAYNKENGTQYSYPGLSAIRSSLDAYPRDVVLKARFGEMAAFVRYGSGEAQADPKWPLDTASSKAPSTKGQAVDLPKSS